MKQWVRKVAVFLKLDELWYGRHKLHSWDRQGQRYRFGMHKSGHDSGPVELLGNFHNAAFNFDGEDTAPLLPKGTQEPFHYLQKRKIGNPALSGAQNPTQKLTSFQRTLIRICWKNIAAEKNMEYVAAKIFRYLCAADTRNVVISFSFVKIIVRTLEYAMSSLDQKQSIKAVYHAVGRTIVYASPRPLSRKHWDNIALGLMEFFTDNIIKDRHYPEAVQAWNQVVCCLVDCLCAGYTAELRLLKRMHEGGDLKLAL